MPSKALLHYAKTHKRTDTSLVDAMQYAREQREAVREEETPEILSEYGVDTRFGIGSFVDAHTIAIEHEDGSVEKVTARRFVICT